MTLNAQENKLAPQHSGDFLPDLCHVKSVLSLILFAQLLSIAISLASTGIANFSWESLGRVSILVLWIMLGSASVLCPLRSWLATQNSLVAGSISYTLVIVVALLCILTGQYIAHGSLINNLDSVLTGSIIAAIFAGVVLRYFYIQQQLRNQQQAQLLANFTALQARIRPHFLFNSMNTIASLIMIDPKTAEKMIVTLSQLLRSSLSEDSMVSLEQEVTLCKDYVSMEQLRLGERLRVHWDIETIPAEQAIPSLLLQPLIENAIYHGVQPLPEGGEVFIKIARENDKIVIIIRNPQGSQSDKSDGNGLALKNIQHRLNALYEHEGTINITKTEHVFSATIRFPIDK